MNTVYLARPIDHISYSTLFRSKTLSEQIRQSNQSLLIYEPARAFSLGEYTTPNTQINTINNAALATADLLLVLWFKNSKSWGVPAEVQQAIDQQKPIPCAASSSTPTMRHSSHLPSPRGRTTRPRSPSRTVCPAHGSPSSRSSTCWPPVDCSSARRRTTRAPPVPTCSPASPPAASVAGRSDRRELVPTPPRARTGDVRPRSTTRATGASTATSSAGAS